MNRSESLMAALGSHGTRLSAAIQGRPIQARLGAYAEWRAPAVLTPLSLYDAPLQPMLDDLYSNPHLTASDAASNWSLCCKLFRSQDFQGINMLLRSMLPVCPFVSGPSAPHAAATNMAIAIILISRHMCRLQLTTDLCLLHMVETIGFDHRGVQFLGDGYRLLPERYVESYLSCARMKMGQAITGSARFNSVYLALQGTLPHLSDELDVIFSVAAHAGAEFEEHLLNSFNILTVDGDRESPERPERINPAELATVQLRQQLARV